jgi:hypothetical protein
MTGMAIKFNIDREVNHDELKTSIIGITKLKDITISRSARFIETTSPDGYIKREATGITDYEIVLPNSELLAESDRLPVANLVSYLMTSDIIFDLEVYFI